MPRLLPAVAATILLAACGDAPEPQVDDSDIENASDYPAYEEVDYGEVEISDDEARDLDGGVLSEDEYEVEPD